MVSREAAVAVIKVHSIYLSSIVVAEEFHRNPVDEDGGEGGDARERHQVAVVPVIAHGVQQRYTRRRQHLRHYARIPSGQQAMGGEW